MTARLSRRLLIGMAAVVTLACGGDSITGSSSPSGSYALQSVNGKVLPYTLLDTIEGGVAFKVEVLSPTTLTLGSGPDWRIVLTSRATFGGFTEIQVDTVAGTYTRSGSALTLTSPGQSSLTGTWIAPDQVILNGDGDILVFKRS